MLPAWWLERKWKGQSSSKMVLMMEPNGSLNNVGSQNQGLPVVLMISIMLKISMYVSCQGWWQKLIICHSIFASRLSRKLEIHEALLIIETLCTELSVLFDKISIISGHKVIMEMLDLSIRLCEHFVITPRVSCRDWYKFIASFDCNSTVLWSRHLCSLVPVCPTHCHPPLDF